MALHWKILIGLALGILWAIVGSTLGWAEFTIDWINPWGTIFINLLKMVAVPLVLFSVMKGMTDLKDASSLGRMGVKTLMAYLVTTVLSVSIGLLLVNSLKPGESASDEQRLINRVSYEIWVSETDGVEILDGKNYLTNPEYESFVGIATQNLRKQQEDEFVKNKISVTQQEKSKGPLQFVVDMVPKNIITSLADTLMLQVIFFAIFFGITLMFISKEKAEPVVNFIDGANEVFLKMVDFVMKAAPFFVFALMAGKLSEMAGNDLSAMIEIFKALGAYCLVVVFGLVIMIFGIYPLIYIAIVAKKKGLNPIAAYRYFFKGIGPAQLLAFSTSSSAATLPVTMDCVRDRMGVSEETTSFVLPVGATVNMDGTSMYQAIAVVFLAQFHLIDLTFAQQTIIVLTATLASIGSAAVPSAGLIMLILVLQSVGLNPAWIAIIFPVDRILDMCRTVVNVTGDATVSSIIAASENQLSLTTEIKEE